MYDNDVISDPPELRDLRDSLSGVAVPKRPSLEAIAARGRTRRRQQLSRVTGLTVVGFAASAAFALGVSGALSPAARLGTIRTAAYTLRHNQNGTATLTLNPGELFNPTQLQSDLAKYGIPARVTVGSYCTSTREPAGFSEVVSGPGPGTSQEGSGQQPSITIDPSQMPSGTELSVGDFQLTSGQFAGEQQADMDLINTSSYSCSSTPPTLGPDTPGFGALYGGSSDGGHTIQLAPGSN